MSSCTMKRFTVWLLCAFILAGCSDLIDAALDAAEKAGGSGNTVLSSLIKRGDGEALEEVNVIYKDADPSRLTLKVGDEWEEPAWYINSSKKPAGTEHELTVDARALNAANYSVMFTGSLRGASHSETVTIAVKSTLTEDVSWTDTGKNSSQTEFDLAAWEGAGESIEKWKLIASETSRVYFAVRKRSFQTITVTGEHGDKVEMAPIGDMVDGLRAAANLDIFTVDTGDVETLFGGGERHFTLMIAEEDKESKLVQIDLEVRPYLTGAAIFAVIDKEGALERITASNVLTYSNDLYKTHSETSFPDWGIRIDDVTGLAGAFKWLDSYAASGTGADNLTEYLVRVEKNETLNRTALTGAIPNSASDSVRNIKIRLRGYGAERRIRHNSSQPMPGDNGYWKGSSDNGLYIKNISLISIGVFVGTSSPPTTHKNITLQLEENITIDAEGLPAGKNEIKSNVVYVADSCVFIMKPGSKLTRAKGIYPVCVDYDTGKFEMDGGEISECKNKAYAVYVSATANTASKANNEFIYRGGTFFNNDSNMVFVGGVTGDYFYSDSLFAPK